MKRIRPSLQFIIFAPALGLILVAGLALYLLVLRTIASYAEGSVSATLSSLLRNAVTIADSEVDRQNRESRASDPDAALIYQLNARMRLEDFARDQGVGLIVSRDQVLDFVTGISPTEGQRILAEAPASATRPLQSTGGKYYVTAANFTPWSWRIHLVKQTADFDAVVREVQWIYGGSALILLAIAGLLVLGLRQILVRPIYRIAREFSESQPPTYHGVKELEHLSDSIGAMLRSLSDKTLHLETTLHSMSDGIAVYDADTRLIFWNSQYTGLNHYPDTLTGQGKPFAEIIRYSVERGDYGLGNSEELVAEVVQRARTLNPPRFEIDRADGSSVEVRRARMPDGGFVTTFTDITDRKRAEREAAGNIAKSRFLENMSHDLRKPISAVIEDCRLLLAGNGGGLPPHQRTAIGNIGANAGHLLGMVDEILYMSRIEADQIEVRAKPISVEATVNQALRVAEPAARAKALVLTSETEPGLEARTDGQLLSRVLTNLLGNAVEYTQRGKITLSVRQRGSDLDLAIADTGAGIPADKLETIFEKFQRLEATAGLSRLGIGLGLGLAISRELARLLGGDIRVESELGKGSTFILTIPAEYGGPRP